MKKHISSVFILLMFFNFVLFLGSNFFINEKFKVLEHYEFKQKVYIHYIRGVYEYYPNIITLGDINEYGKRIKNTSSLFSLDYELHKTENGYYDKLYAFLAFSPREGLNWVLTTVECEIMANIMGVKILYTSKIKLKAPFSEEYMLKPNYSSPFSEWFWLESSAGVDFGLDEHFRIDFIREGIDLGIKNSSDPLSNRIVVKVPKDNYAGLWNFTIFVGIKDIEFKGNQGEVDNYIVLIANFNIRSYEIKYVINYFPLIIWFIDIALLVLLAILILKNKEKYLYAWSS